MGVANNQKRQYWPAYGIQNCGSQFAFCLFGKKQPIEKVMMMKKLMTKLIAFKI